MPVVDDLVPVTLILPQSTLERVTLIARRKNETLEDELEALVESGLTAELSYQDKFDRLSERYRRRLEEEGKLHQTAEEVMDELRAIREQVANELYPD